MTPSDLLDAARTTTRDRFADVDTDGLREAAATNLAAARETTEARLAEASRFLEAKVDEANEALEDDDTRSRAVGIASGIAGFALVAWALRRWRRARQEAELEEALYESTESGIPGWTDPRAEDLTKADGNSETADSDDTKVDS